MSDLVFVHGWGFDRSFWDGVASKVNGASKSFVDLGFTGHEQLECPKDAVYITHSMGFAWILEQGVDPEALIIINGFSRFTQCEDWVQGVHPRILKRMIRQFEKAPEAVWGEFMKNCGAVEPVYPQGADEQKLNEGLRYLETCDVRAKYAELTCPRLVLSGEQDQIVAQELSIASFSEEVVWYKQGDHLLPLSQTDEISREINTFLSRHS